MRIFRFLIPVLLLCAVAPATTITITGAPFSYDGVAVGPYYATLDGVPNILVFCLDMNLSTQIGQSYAGGLSLSNDQTLEEVSFLAAYALQNGAPDVNQVNSLEGPVSLAIWQIMGTSDVAPDLAAQPFVLMAQDAYVHGQIPQALLDRVVVWSPALPGASQRFLRVDPETESPEPGTILFIALGLLMITCGLAGRKLPAEFPKR